MRSKKQTEWQQLLMESPLAYPRGKECLEEGGGLIIAGESSKSSDMLYYMASSSDKEEELIWHLHQIPEIAKVFFTMEGEQSLVEVECQQKVSNFTVRGFVKLCDLFCFDDGIICFSMRVLFQLFFLLVTSLKSGKSGEVKASSLTGATDGEEETDKLVIGGDALAIESGGLELEIEISGYFWTDGAESDFFATET
ncbi:hypothetical protein AVEN_215018-1 [Araneus ventricosus]|uniref:Uncharacterized protein n=1 Tax=Araneus ventricosus TaxID=182803 RepID=A0A4Y2VDA2_ARAVE|nr:hypothetical protein AVEN_215018-1 [Araneus ventricosus]